MIRMGTAIDKGLKLFVNNRRVEAFDPIAFTDCLGHIDRNV
jgi:hypothetical protein